MLHFKIGFTSEKVFTRYHDKYACHLAQWLRDVGMRQSSMPYLQHRFLSSVWICPQVGGHLEQAPERCWCCRSNHGLRKRKTYSVLSIIVLSCPASDAHKCFVTCVWSHSCQNLTSTDLLPLRHENVCPKTKLINMGERTLLWCWGWSTGLNGASLVKLTFIIYIKQNFLCSFETGSFHKAEASLWLVIVLLFVPSYIELL